MASQRAVNPAAFRDYSQPEATHPERSVQYTRAIRCDVLPLVLYASASSLLPRWLAGSVLFATALVTNPATAPGWERERVWSGHDDWEPYIAADRSSSYVYQMTTRFNAYVSGIFIRRSPDSGATWLGDHLVAPVNRWQADPQVQVADNDTVLVVWLDGPNWTSRLIKSTDHGAT